MYRVRAHWDYSGKAAGLDSDMSAEDHIDQIELSYRYDLGMGVKAASDSPVGLGVVGSQLPFRELLAALVVFR